MTDSVESEPQAPTAGNVLLLILSWLWVGVPLAWGVWKTLESSMPLFQ